jgi:hypothetical protein
MYHFILSLSFHLLFAFDAVLSRIVFRLVKFSVAPILRTARPALPSGTTWILPYLPCCIPRIQHPSLEHG